MRWSKSLQVIVQPSRFSVIYVETTNTLLSLFGYSPPSNSFLIAVTGMFKCHTTFRYQYSATTAFSCFLLRRQINVETQWTAMLILSSSIILHYRFAWKFERRRCLFVFVYLIYIIDFSSFNHFFLNAILFLHLVGCTSESSLSGQYYLLLLLAH